MRELANKVAVITGAGSGIGRGMAHAFADAGMKLLIADIDGQAAERVAGELEALGHTARSARVDVVSLSEMEALAELVWREWGGVHLLCNNAGVTTFGLMCEGIASADWDWVLAVNLRGVINGLQAFLPRMRELEGEKHVVNTASIAGISASPLVGPYAASKHGVVGLSETLRAEGAGYEISCSALCPSNVDTAIVEADRNRQSDFGGPTGAGNEMIAAHVAQGLDPMAVGRLVVEGVREDMAFIFTHADTRALVDARYESMRTCLDWADGVRASVGVVPKDT
jgi:NAD(P)-dependent dehydrogenase (short-subunit alcohol dehydrogenase family)